MRFEFEKIAYYNYGSNDQIEKKNLTNGPRTKNINKKIRIKTEISINEKTIMKV
jgi:hypothetical protein